MEQDSAFHVHAKFLEIDGVKGQGEGVDCGETS